MRLFWSALTDLTIRGVGGEGWGGEGASCQVTVCWCWLS